MLHRHRLLATVFTSLLLGAPVMADDVKVGDQARTSPFRAATARPTRFRTSRARPSFWRGFQRPLPVVEPRSATHSVGVGS
jgi:hypothetical protein